MIILADPVYNPENQTTINSATKLGPGITIAKFLGAYGDRTPFNHIEALWTRRQIARNLYPHAEAMKMINESPLFEDIRLIVSEGILQPKDFTWSGGVIDEKRFGRLVYYQVVDKEGKIDFEKTFDIAEYWKDYIEFDTLYLDYDSYNTDGSLTAQIGLKFPEIPSTFDVTMKNNVETWYNNNLMSKNELIEIRETE
jgi:hypothetical protein